ncbi:MAG: cytochrome c [Anaerolineales bacterium]|nr:cytochrome c [Anaerolineales bacterium]
MLLAACGGTAVPPPTPTLSAQAQQGKAIFSRDCGSCHSTAEDTIIVGPSLAGVAGRAATRVPGQDATTYLLTSIMRPDSYLVAGFEDLMPQNFAKDLTGEELDAVVAYLLTLE